MGNRSSESSSYQGARPADASATASKATKSDVPCNMCDRELPPEMVASLNEGAADTMEYDPRRKVLHLQFVACCLYPACFILYPVFRECLQVAPRVFAYMHSGCPVTRSELGRGSWAFLHTMAAFYPDTPSREQQEEMRQFLYTYVKLYPCNYCSDRSLEEMDSNPPRVSSRHQLTRWMCALHNEVNHRMGKPIFDCEKVEERWRDGPSDGSCDTKGSKHTS